MNSPSSSTSIFQAHVAVALFGLSGLLGKAIAASAHTIVFGRALIAAVVLSTFARLAKSPRESRTWSTLKLGSGVLLAGHWIAFFHAIQVSTVAIALFSFSTFPFFVILLEHSCGGVNRIPEICSWQVSRWGASGLCCPMTLLAVRMSRDWP